MDNVEAARGLADYAWLLGSVLGDPARRQAPRRRGRRDPGRHRGRALGRLDATRHVRLGGRPAQPGVGRLVPRLRRPALAGLGRAGPGRAPRRAVGGVHRALAGLGRQHPGVREGLGRARPEREHGLRRGPRRRQGGHWTPTCGRPRSAGPAGRRRGPSTTPGSGRWPRSPVAPCADRPSGRPRAATTIGDVFAHVAVPVVAAPVKRSEMTASPCRPMSPAPT